MKKLIKYNDYQLELISESIKKDEAVLYLSNRLKSIIEYIDSPISIRLLINNNNTNYRYKITLLDVNDKKDSQGNDILDSISFSQPNKVYDYVSDNCGRELGYDRDETEMSVQQYNYYNRYIRNNNDIMFNVRGRSETSLGRIVKKLYNDIFNDKQIEDFVNRYKTLREKPIFEIVSGDDIVFWYNQDNYQIGGGSLNSSCMRDPKKSDIIRFYAINKDKVRLLILKDSKDNNKIKGRALLWYLDEPDGRVFMDRIYTTVSYLENNFKEYAEENGFIYKMNQDMYSYTPLIDTKIGEVIKNVRVDGIRKHIKYPYMDTLKFFNTKDGVLKNYYNEDEVDIFILESVHGGIEGLNGSANIMWSDYYSMEIDLDDAYYCEFIDDYRFGGDCYYSSFYDTHIDYEYRNENMVECEYYDDESDTFRLIRDTVKMYDGEYATLKYAKNNNVQYSKYLDGGVEYGVWSTYYNSYIGETREIDIIQVRLEPTTEPRFKFDYRIHDDGTYYEYRGYYFDNNIKKEEIEL